VGGRRQRGERGRGEQNKAKAHHAFQIQDFCEFFQIK